MRKPHKEYRKATLKDMYNETAPLAICKISRNMGARSSALPKNVTHQVSPPMKAALAISKKHDDIKLMTGIPVRLMT
jgi:hypothetical protein